MKVPELPAVELGEPWRLGDDLQGVGVPILIQTTPNQRGYKLNTEDGAKYELTDTGNISKLKIHNQSDEHLFFRKGTIVKGGSQTRALQASVLIEPQAKAAMADIRCVYASKGIRRGAKMSAVRSLTPHSVTSSLRKGQSETWGSAKAYAFTALSSSTRDSTGVGASSYYMDVGDLGGRMDNLEEVLVRDDDRISDALKNIPADHIRQIGLVVVDLGGVRGFELFDHPASWGAFSDSIVKSFQEILTNAMPELYDINMEKVKEYVFAFLQQLAVADSKEVFPNTWEIVSEKVEGEFTMLDGEVIHILAGKREKGAKSKPKPRRRTPPMPSPWRETTIGVGPARTNQRPLVQHVNGQMQAANIVHHVTRKRGFETMSALMRGARTFSEVEEDTGMSSRTVSRGLKDGEELGLIEKVIRDNGNTAYKLTALGESTNPKKFKAAYE